MADINHVVLVGRLTRNAELKYTNNGGAVSKFSIAINQRRKKEDQWVDEAHFFDIVLWGKTAESLNQYLVKVRVIQEIDHPSHAHFTADPLAPRELECLRLIARGMSNAEIAREMHLHPRTVAKYVSAILEKLQLASRTQAALYAVREGLTEPREKK